MTYRYELPADHTPWERLTRREINLSSAADYLTADDRAAIADMTHAQRVREGWQRELDRRATAGGVDGLYELAHGGGEEWAKQELTARAKTDPDVAERVRYLKRMDHDMGRTDDRAPATMWGRTPNEQAVAEYAAAWVPPEEPELVRQQRQNRGGGDGLVPIIENPRVVAERDEFLRRVDASEAGEMFRAGMASSGGRESVPAPGQPGSADYTPGSNGAQVIGYRFADGSPMSDGDPVGWADQFKPIYAADESREDAAFFKRAHQSGLGHRSARETELRERWRREDRDNY